MELHSVILFVDDLAASVGFYRDLLGLPEIFKDEITSVLGLGSSTLVLHRSEVGPQGSESLHQSPPESRFSGTVWPNCGPGVAVGRHALRFQVEDPDALHERLVASGARVLDPPVDYWWGRCVLVADPEGRPIALARMTFSIPAQHG